MKNKILIGKHRSLKIDLLNDCVTVCSKNIKHDKFLDKDIEVSTDKVSFSEGAVAFLTFTERQSRVFNDLRDRGQDIRPSILYALKQAVYLKKRTKLSFNQMIAEIETSCAHKPHFKLSPSRHFSTLILLKYLTNYRLDCYTATMLHANYLKKMQINFNYCIGATTITPHLHTWIEVNSEPFLDLSASSYIKIFEIKFYAKSI